MKFGPVPLTEAAGAVLAHSVRLIDGGLRKGKLLTEADLERLRAGGVETVTVARLEEGDLAEDAAAARLAAALAGETPGQKLSGLHVSAPFTGRANLYAAAAGILDLDPAAIAEANAVDEAVTLATLAPKSRVDARQMLATVKIIPYAAPESAVAKVEAILRQAAPAIRLSPFSVRTAGLALTRTPGMSDAFLDKGEAAIRARLAALGVTLSEVRRTAHETGALAEALADLPGEIMLVLAGSATTDRRDVTPAAIERAGGVVERLGMPVDPGNLLALGRIDEKPVLGLPGCARSPKLNGADWVLERLVAKLEVASADIAAMGVGGLLKEIPSRPQPRHGKKGASGEREATARRPFVSAVMLAAGGSSRMEGRHKLLETIDGAPLARLAAERMLASAADELVVVLGAQSEAIRAALDGLKVRFVENPSWREGVASSIRAGLKGAAPEADAALIAFADMPEIDAALVDRLIAAFDPDERREIIRPIAGSGRAGHPVLFGRRFFEALSALSGDIGARRVVAEHAEFVTDIAAGSEAPLIDLDSPEDWAAWRARASRTG